MDITIVKGSVTLMQVQEQFDNKISQALTATAEKITPSDYMFKKISERISYNSTDSRLKPNRINFKKVVAVSFCCIVLLAGSIAAANYFRYASGIKDYSAVPSQTQIEQDAGFKANIPETLPGGYKNVTSSLVGEFESPGNLVQNGNKAVSAMYKLREEDKNSFIGLSVSNEDVKSLTQGSVELKINGVLVYWRQYKIHYIGHDYISTKDEPADVLSIVTSGNNKDYYESIRSLIWRKNGVNYILTEQGYNLTQEQLTSIAESIINSK